MHIGKFLGRRGSHKTTKKGVPKRDQYETPEIVSKALLKVFGPEIPLSSTIYCPCYGKGKLFNVLESYSIDNCKKWVFLIRDLYADNEEEKEDYLTAPDYNYDFLIEHPPWGKNVVPFLNKAFKSNKPFLFLLSTEVLTYKITNRVLRENGAIIYLIAPKPSFFHKGRKVQVGGCMWVLGNCGEKINGLVFGETMELMDDDEEDDDDEEEEEEV